MGMNGLLMALDGSDTASSFGTAVSDTAQMLTDMQSAVSSMDPTVAEKIEGLVDELLASEEDLARHLADLRRVHTGSSVDGGDSPGRSTPTQEKCGRCQYLLKMPVGAWDFGRVLDTA